MKYSPKVLIISSSIIAGLTLILYFIKFHEGLSSNVDHWGGFGSYIGGTIGVIFAFASVIFLYETLKSQRQSSDEQAKNFIIQNFESAFFQMLTIQRDLLNNIKVESPEVYSSGSEYQVQGVEYMEAIAKKLSRK